jgi:predicted permease
MPYCPYLATSRFRRPKDNQEMWTILGLVVGLTLLVLIVACSNVGNLVLSRAIGRTREFSVRTALGASRWRIMRQLLMECLLLACLGALGGILLAAWGSRTFAALTELPAYLDFTPDARLVVAATVAGLASMLATGLAPAWRISRQDLTAAMKDGGQQTSGGLERTRLRKLLVASQVAGCCLLLVVAGLMIRGLQRLLSADRGFDFYNVATLKPLLSRYGMKGESARAWWDSVRRAIALYPETESVAIVSTAPLGRGLNTTSHNDAPRIKITRIDAEPGFFALMKIPVLVGRDFVPSDDYRSTVIISRRVAMEMYGKLDVLGKSFPKSVTKEHAKTIVGVAGDAHMLKIAATDLGEMYSPLNPAGYANYQLIARARTDAERLIGPMRRAARATDDRVLAQATLMRAEFHEKLRVPRLASSIAGLTGLLALRLACIGIYGVVAFSAARRTKEIGIRMALGATRPAVLRMLVRQQAWPLLLGVVIGMAGAIPAGRALQGEPFYLNPTDPLVQSAVILVFVLTGGIATVLPGLRALRLDPVRALHHD